MLVLTRRVGQSIVIGDDVVVTVLEVRGDSVRLGVEAPRAVEVHREEVWREVQGSDRSASSSTGAADAPGRLRRPADDPPPPPASESS